MNKLEAVREPTTYRTGKNSWTHDTPVYQNGVAVRWLLGPCPSCGSVTSTYGGSYSCHKDHCQHNAEVFACNAGPKPHWWNSDIQVYMDGDAWCAVGDGFINLQESPAGFGKTPSEAVDALNAIRAIPLDDLIQPEGDAPVWHKGYPKAHRAEEWFIARTIHGDRVVLMALPEDFSYDFTTADQTYMKKENVTHWMPFPDSQYLAPQPSGDVVRELVEALTQIQNMDPGAPIVSGTPEWYQTVANASKLIATAALAKVQEPKP